MGGSPPGSAGVPPATLFVQAACDPEAFPRTVHQTGLCRVRYSGAKSYAGVPPAPVRAQPVPTPLVPIDPKQRFSSPYYPPGLSRISPARSAGCAPGGGKPVQSQARVNGSFTSMHRMRMIFFRKRLATNFGNPQTRTGSSPELASGAGSSGPVNPVHPVHRCSIIRESGFAGQGPCSRQAMKIRCFTLV